MDAKMGDLISRKRMLHNFRNWQTELAKVGNEREYNLLETMIRGIKNEPTAFDLDGLIFDISERLQERIEYYGRDDCKEPMAYRECLEFVKSAIRKETEEE